MAIANPRIHIICGICGCNRLMSYEIITELNDDTLEKEQKVVLKCDNCSSITYLDELVKEIK